MMQYYKLNVPPLIAPLRNWNTRRTWQVYFLRPSFNRTIEELKWCIARSKKTWCSQPLIAPLRNWNRMKYKWCTTSLRPLIAPLRNWNEKQTLRSIAQDFLPLIAPLRNWNVRWNTSNRTRANSFNRTIEELKLNPNYRTFGFTASFNRTIEELK